MGASNSIDAAEFRAKYGTHYAQGMYGVVFVPFDKRSLKVRGSDMYSGGFPYPIYRMNSESKCYPPVPLAAEWFTLKKMNAAKMYMKDCLNCSSPVEWLWDPRSNVVKTWPRSYTRLYVPGLYLCLCHVVSCFCVMLCRVFLHSAWLFSGDGQSVPLH